MTIAVVTILTAMIMKGKLGTDIITITEDLSSPDNVAWDTSGRYLGELEAPKWREKDISRR